MGVCTSKNPLDGYRLRVAGDLDRECLVVVVYPSGEVKILSFSDDLHQFINGLVGETKDGFLVYIVHPKKKM